jgi:hypothetical protein
LQRCASAAHTLLPCCARTSHRPRRRRSCGAGRRRVHPRRAARRLASRGARATPRANATAGVTHSAAGCCAQRAHAPTRAATHAHTHAVCCASAPSRPQAERR